MREFDRPRRRRPAWLPWLLASVAVVVVLVLAAGFVGGVGPLRSLGLVTSDLNAVGYRPTSGDSVIQVSVAMPATGLCRDDDISVVAFERGNRVEVESTITRSRNSTCSPVAVGGDLRWIDVELDAPLGDRAVIRATDREPLSRQTSPLG